METTLTEVGILNHVVNKLDISIDKITQVSNDIAKLLAVHDERITQLEKTTDRRSNDIIEIHSRLTTQTKEILSELYKVEEALEQKISESSNNLKISEDKQQTKFEADYFKLDERLSNLEKFKYYLAGIVAAIVFFANKFFEFIIK